MSERADKKSGSIHCGKWEAFSGILKLPSIPINKEKSDFRSGKRNNSNGGCLRVLTSIPKAVSNSAWENKVLFFIFEEYFP